MGVERRVGERDGVMTFMSIINNDDRGHLDIYQKLSDV